MKFFEVKQVSHGGGQTLGAHDEGSLGFKSEFICREEVILGIQWDVPREWNQCPVILPSPGTWYAEKQERPGNRVTRSTISLKA
jgi:hypothetical protein